ncbi:MAG: mucoidy inhibitor MuiA family protein [Promethearchaeota archaeon]
MAIEDLPKIETKITAVTVYRDGARIERSGAITLKPGTHKLRIPDLTRFLDKESVRVSGRGHASILSFDTVDSTVEVSGYEKLDSLVKRKQDLEKKRAEINQTLARIGARENYFSQILSHSAAEFSRWIPAGECAVDQVTSLDTLTTTNLAKLEKERIKAQTELRALEKEIAIATREIEKFRRSVQQYEVTNTIILNIDAQKAGKAQFNVTYFVRRASWAPTYDIDLKEDAADITTFTVVINNSLEDWDNVKLTVSTASSRPAVISEPHPLLLRVYTPRATGRSAASGAKFKMDRRIATEEERREGYVGGAAGEVTTTAMDQPTAPPPEMDLTTATAVETGGVHVFILPEAVKVPADGEPHAFRISHTKLPAERKYFWNAVDFAEVIEVTQIKNGDTVLLPGRAKVYSGEDYIGESVLKVVAPHEEFDVGTRFTYDLKVEKKLVEKGAEKSGFTGGKVAREYSYELAIKNYRKSPSPIKVMDRIPHSDSEKIKVDEKRITPKPTETRLGILTWEIDIPAGGEEKITYEYEVEYPREIRIHPPLP